MRSSRSRLACAFESDTCVGTKVRFGRTRNTSTTTGWPLVFAGIEARSSTGVTWASYSGMCDSDQNIYEPVSIRKWSVLLGYGETCDLSKLAVSLIGWRGE